MFQRITNLWPKKLVTPDGTLSGQNIQNHITSKNRKDGRVLKHQVISDANIKIRVVAALLANPQTDRAFIRVKSEQGLVTLDGRVATWEAKIAARLVASRQKDVCGIVDKITVVPNAPVDELTTKSSFINY